MINMKIKYIGIILYVLGNIDKDKSYIYTNLQLWIMNFIFLLRYIYIFKS